MGACAMLAEVEPGLKLCNACGDPPDQQGLCDGERWACFMLKQTAVVEELCKLTTSDPAPCAQPGSSVKQVMLWLTTLRIIGAQIVV